MSQSERHDLHEHHEHHERTIERWWPLLVILYGAFFVTCIDLFNKT